MARIVIALHAAPAADTPAQHRSLLAYQYAQAALVSGHQIDMVFFYSDAVLHAAKRQNSGAAHQAVSQWQLLASQHNVPLVICNTVAEVDHQMTTEDLVSPFQNGGLTEFSMAAAAADHVIQF
ncbi:DsrE family protein [Pseudidiomarina marina]|uniref:DsrE/DsrF/TusD sulfur relay family protein n=1 Tax=Pseudidiomarina marina TaxID=502366 RepID=UPI00384A6A3C